MLGELLVDDWVETGSQARACQRLIEVGGAEFVGAAALVQDCTDQLATELNLRAVVEVSELGS